LARKTTIYAKTALSPFCAQQELIEAFFSLNDPFSCLNRIWGPLFQTSSLFSGTIAPLLTLKKAAENNVCSRLHYHRWIFPVSST
jgi:hypothetical protein